MPNKPLDTLRHPGKMLEATAQADSDQQGEDHRLDLPRLCGFTFRTCPRPRCPCLHAATHTPDDADVCDTCGERVYHIDAGFSPALQEMRHGCGGRWR